MRLGLRSLILSVLATTAFQLLILVIYILDLSLGDGTAPRPVDRLLGFSAEDISQGQVWRLLSAALVHTSSGIFGPVGLIHILVNSVSLWIVGPTLERVVGSAMWVLCALASAVSGFGAVLLFHGNEEYFGGSSAITWGLLAAGLFILAVGGMAKRKAFLVMLIFAIYLLALNVGQMVLIGVQYRHIVHAGGALGGTLFAFFWLKAAMRHPDAKARRLS